MHDWIKGDPTETIEERCKSNKPFSGKITYGNIRTFADFTRFQLRSAYKIGTIIFPGQIIDDQEFDNLLWSLEAGIPADCIDLPTLPFQMQLTKTMQAMDKLLDAYQEDLITMEKKLEDLKTHELALDQRLAQENVGATEEIK